MKSWQAFADGTCHEVAMIIPVTITDNDQNNYE